MNIISSNYIFKGLAFETLGPWCKEAIDFINVIGNRLIAESGDSKSKKFLFERISLAIQRGNAFGALFQISHYYRKFLHCKFMNTYKNIIFNNLYALSFFFFKKNCPIKSLHINALQLLQS
jgi:hypothetical protein